MFQIPFKEYLEKTGRNSLYYSGETGNSAKPFRTLSYKARRLPVESVGCGLKHLGRSRLFSRTSVLPVSWIRFGQTADGIRPSSKERMLKMLFSIGHLHVMAGEIARLKNCRQGRLEALSSPETTPQRPCLSFSLLKSPAKAGATLTGGGSSEQPSRHATRKVNDDGWQSADSFAPALRLRIPPPLENILSPATSWRTHRGELLNPPFRGGFDVS